MIKLLEPELELKVRDGEVDLVEGMLEDCQSKFSELMQEQTGQPFETKLSVIQDKFLTVEEGGSCGGVILYALNRRIVCPNTLEDRLNLTFEQELPKIRKLLFPRD